MPGIYPKGITELRYLADAWRGAIRRLVEVAAAIKVKVATVPIMTTDM